MMIPMTKEMREVFDNMSDREKIRMFYELAKYIVKIQLIQKMMILKI